MKIVAALAFAVLTTASALAQQQKEPSGRVLSSANGRYVFGQVSEYRRDQYMLDTQTGRLWKIVSAKSKGADGSETSYEVLEWVPYSLENINAAPPPMPK